MFNLLLFGFRDGIAMLDKHYHHCPNDAQLRNTLEVSTYDFS